MASKERSGKKGEPVSREALDLALNIERNNTLIDIRNKLGGASILQRDGGGTTFAASIVLGCETNTTVTGKGEKKEGTSSLDMGANEQAAKEAEAKTNAETAAKQDALDKAIADAGQLTCESGCEPDVDSRTPEYTEVFSRATGQKDVTTVPFEGSVISCRWGWEAKFNAKIKFKCNKVG
jgi:hypothetical protein